MSTETDRYNQPADRPASDFALLEAFHRVDCLGGAERAHDNCWDAIDAVRAVLTPSSPDNGREEATRALTAELQKYAMARPVAGQVGTLGLSPAEIVDIVLAAVSPSPQPSERAALFVADRHLLALYLDACFEESARPDIHAADLLADFEADFPASPLPEPEGRADAANLVLRVVTEHEPRPMGCRCGAGIGDSIDRCWHLVNQAVSAALGINPPLGAAVRSLPEGRADREGLLWLLLTDIEDTTDAPVPEQSGWLPQRYWIGRRLRAILTTTRPRSLPEGPEDRQATT